MGLRNILASIFHRRTIIIVSQRQVSHVPMTARSQFLLFGAVVGFVGWASYSTGGYMAARSTVKQQGQTIRAITTARVEDNFRPMLGATLARKKAEPELPDLTDPLFTLSALRDHKLNNKIAMLEQRVTELESENEAIIERVRIRTAGRIDDLESIIRQTGLDPDKLQQQAAKDDKLKAEGGPMIPADFSTMREDEQAMYEGLQQLSTLQLIVGDMPLGVPMHNAQEQSGFGHRIDPFTRHLAFHAGLDMSGPSGAEIISTADGTVVSAGRNGAYGNSVDVDHGLGLTTRYGHMSRILVSRGQSVRKGEVLGIQGSTGRSTGAHVHYEVRYHDDPMDPKNFVTVGRYAAKE